MFSTLLENSNAIFIKLKVVVCKLFKFGKSLKFVVWETVNYHHVEIPFVLFEIDLPKYNNYDILSDLLFIYSAMQRKTFEQFALYVAVQMQISVGQERYTKILVRVFLDENRHSSLDQIYPFLHLYTF